MNINMKDIISRLEVLLKTPSPTGNTEKVNAYVRELFEEIQVPVRFTEKGALIATIEGRDTNRSVTLSGHVDTLGAMVKELKSNGRLKISQLGGYVMDTVEGEHVVVEAMDGRTYTGTLVRKFDSCILQNPFKSFK